MTTLVDTQAAALAVGVEPATIRKWEQRGLLAKVGRQHRRNLYDLEQVCIVHSRWTKRLPVMDACVTLPAGGTPMPATAP